MEKFIINVCTLETQMSKCRGDFKSKGNPKIRIKALVRTKFKKSSILKNTVGNIFYLDIYLLMDVLMQVWPPGFAWEKREGGLVPWTHRFSGTIH